MALKGQYTTADHLSWDQYQLLLMKLSRDGRFKDATIIALAVNTLLRFSDFSKITWADILDNEVLQIQETKTGKVRRIKVNNELRSTVVKTVAKESVADLDKPIVNFSIQYLNRLLKDIKVKYSLNVRNLSTHSFRKTAGRRIAEKHQFSGEVLLMLMDLFNHSSLAITKRYLGIRQEEIESLYDELAL
ncbi:integrase [Flammeovirgaceae bacterium 311]|nr:integrase [Flammeovirgaceae bacterium 311]